MSRAVASIRPDLLALGFIAAVSLAVTWPVTIGGRALLPTGLYMRMQPWRAHLHEFPDYRGPGVPILDAVQQFYPWRLFAARTVRAGEIPLWNPQMLSGAPFVANGQSAVFYPETWLHYLIDPLRALGWATLLFHLLAAGGMYAFLRALGVRPPGAAIGGITFALSGFFTGWLTFPALRSVAGWLPLIVLGVELAVRRLDPRWLGLTALGVGMQFLAGHLQVSVYVLLAMVAYALFRLVPLGRERGLGAGVRWAALIAAAGAIGGLLAACQLAPSLEFARLNYRSGGVGYQTQVHHALATPQLLLGLMPDVFGNPAHGNHWGADLNTWWGRAYRTYSETSWYLGIGPLVLAICGLVLRPRSQSWFWLAMFLVALALAFGTPLNLALRRLVPGYDQLTGVGRALMLACAAGAVLAGLGAEALMRARDTRLRPGAVLAATCLALLLVGLAGGMATWVFSGSLEAAGLPVELGGYTLGQIGRFAVLLLASWVTIAWAVASRSHCAWWALAVLVAVDLGVFMQRFTPEGPVEYLDIEPAVVAAIRSDEPARIASIGPDFLNRMPPNTHMIFGLQSMQGSESLIYEPYHTLLGAATSERYGFAQVDPAHAALDMLAVRYLVTPLVINVPGWRLVGNYETRLYENEQAAPRAFLAREVISHSTRAHVLAAIESPEFDPRSIHIVGAGPMPAERPPVGEARVTEYGANQVLVEGDLAAGGWLVLADVAYPGWRAYLDGVEAPIVAANLVCRAVRLERAGRSVRFVYLPSSFRLGMFGTLVALGLLAGLVGFHASGGRPR